MKSRIKNNFANDSLCIQDDFEAIKKIVDKRCQTTGKLDDNMVWLDVNHLTDGHTIYDIRHYKRKP